MMITMLHSTAPTHQCLVIRLAGTASRAHHPPSHQVSYTHISYLECYCRVASLAHTHISHPHARSAGKRMLIKGDLDEAAEAFEMGLQKVATEYGELSDHCAEAYHLYGSTLLRIAKRDASIFSESGGGAEAGEDEDGDGDEEGDGDNVCTTACSCNHITTPRLVLCLFAL